MGRVAGAPLTEAELKQRRTNVKKIAVQRRKATHCKRNHEFTKANTIWKSDGCRQCRTCCRDAQYYSKKRNER